MISKGHQSINHSSNQPTNRQSTKTHRSINQSINQPNQHFLSWKFWKSEKSTKCLQVSDASHVIADQQPDV